MTAAAAAPKMDNRATRNLLNLQCNRPKTTGAPDYTGWVELNGFAIPVCHADSLDDFEYYCAREGYAGWRFRQIGERETRYLKK